MLSIRSTTTNLLLASLAAAAMGASTVSGEVLQVTDRCAIYGSGFVDLGNGTCGQAGHAANQWNGGGTSNAGLRSDGAGMLPGAGNARHLRIQSQPEFR